jgi:outer membrane lipoprotein-sorting protein
MNCAECRDNLVTCVEGLLDREEKLQCRAHLDACAACRAAYEAITSLQRCLIARGQATAEVRIVEPVMRRVLQEQKKTERETIMSTILKHRWGFGFGTAAGAAAIILITLLTLPKTQATAAEAIAAMTKGAQAVAKLTSIHLHGQLRTEPQDNFSYINADCPFYTIELWKQFEPELKWRIEKPKRVAVMDGQSTVMLIKTDNTGVKVPQRTTSAFDTEWLHRIANLSNTISNELDNARAKGWQLSLAEEQTKEIVTIEAKPGLPDNDYLKNSFFDNADTRRVYVFDNQTKLLESVKVYLHATFGDKLIFELDQIDYNQPIDPSVWKLELPADVNWAQLPEKLAKLPDNEKYASMTAKQAARAFFEDCSREDWNEAGKFISPVTPRLKQYLGGLKIVSLGEPFTSKTYPGQFIPYEIKLPVPIWGLRWLHYGKKYNLAIRKDNPAGRWQVDGGI